MTTTRRRATAALETTRSELEELESKQALSEYYAKKKKQRRGTSSAGKMKDSSRRRSTCVRLAEEPSLIGIFEEVEEQRHEEEDEEESDDEDDDYCSQQSKKSMMNQKKKRQKSLVGFQLGVDDDDEHSKLLKSLAQRKHALAEKRKQSTTLAPELLLGLDEEIANEQKKIEIDTKKLYEERFLAFIEAGRAQANEMARRKTDAKLQAISVLPKEQWARAYCEAQVAQSWGGEGGGGGGGRRMKMDDLEYHDPMEQSFSVFSKSVAALQFSQQQEQEQRQRQYKRRNNNNNNNNSNNNNALSSSSPLTFSSSSSTTTTTTTTTTTSFEQQQQQPKQRDNDDNDDNVRGGLRQVKAAQGAAAIAAEQQRKIVSWRFADDSELWKPADFQHFRFDKNNNFLNLSPSTSTTSTTSFPFNSPQKRQQKMSSFVAFGGTNSRSSDDGEKTKFNDDARQGNEKKVLQEEKQQQQEKTIVGFTSMSVDESGFDAAVSALTSESHLVQRAGRRARWWAQQRQNTIEKEFRNRVKEAVEKGEKDTRDSVIKNMALESLLPSALSEARVATLAYAEDRARLTIESDQRNYWKAIEVGFL